MYWMSEIFTIFSRIISTDMDIVKFNDNYDK